MLPKIKPNHSLKAFNTFTIDVGAKCFAAVRNNEELISLLKLSEFKNQSKLVLGGGSNVLFTQNFDGLVIRNEIHGITVAREDHDYLYLTVGAGENWHNLVLYCVNNGFGGIENLSLIPGTVGAAPIQNIGAYGVELKDVFYALEAIKLDDATKHTFCLEDCKFGYRDSVFKREFKNQMMITYVTLRLQKKHRLNASYSSLKDYLTQQGITQLDLKTISNAVIAIRQQKLPDPKVIGNAGSFFKNPLISRKHFQTLVHQYKDIPHFNHSENTVKVNAAWLIEQCGYKGKRAGRVGVYEKQALVLVNHGNATGTEVLSLAKEIQNTVKSKFDIMLEMEVQII